MNKVIITVLVAALSVSCGKTWDLVNPDVCCFVRNADGENLLDPATEGNILDNEITVDYNGETYGMNGNAGTRASHEVWYGLRVEPYNDFSDDTPVLKFGEFRSTSHDSGSYRGETLTINWGDGTSDEIKFDLYVKGSHNVKQKIWLNGELQSEDSLEVTIVK
jgi:hypothetical protein